MIIDCISDLHGFYPKLKGGDLLIVAGDLTARDTWEEAATFKLWLHNQEYKKKIVIAGNHDNHLVGISPGSFYFSAFNKINGDQISYADYLFDSGTEFEGLRIWGSPWTKTFKGMNPNCKAFTCDTEEELAEKWALIPNDTDILITHSPPLGILDKVERHDIIGLSYPPSKLYEHCGSKSLDFKIGHMENPPKVWVFGHIHEGYGEDLSVRGKPCKMINASHVNERYQPVNKPIRVIL